MAVDDYGADQLKDKHFEEAGELLETYANAADTRDAEKVQEAVLNFLQHAVEHKIDEEDPWLKAMDDATRCEEALDWEGAEAAYQRSMTLTADSLGNQYLGNAKLSKLFSLLGNYKSALAAASLARQFAVHAEMKPLRADALLREASLLLEGGHDELAQERINEVLSCCREGGKYDRPRAAALVARARCFTQAAQFAEARADLKNAQRLLGPYTGMPLLADFQIALADWWAVSANLDFKEGNKQRAVAAFQESVQILREIVQLPHLEGPYKHNWLALGLKDLGRAMLAVDDPRAETVLAESRAIREWFGLPPLAP